MATYEQLREMRENLVGELMDVVGKYRVEVGAGLSASDVIGALEWAKLEVYKEAQGDYLLNNTYMDNT